MQITEKAKKYIQQHGSKVTIEINGVGCCVPIYIALAEPMEPDNPESYQKFCLDGIMIFYPLGAVINEEVFQIDMVTVNCYSRLEVEGIER